MYLVTLGMKICITIWGARVVLEPMLHRRLQGQARGVLEGEKAGPKDGGVGMRIILSP